MLLTRDKDSQGLICLWIDVKKNELYMCSNGMWAVAEVNKCPPRIMEIVAEQFKKVFVGEPPEKGFIKEVNKLQFETVSGLLIEGK